MYTFIYSSFFTSSFSMKTSPKSGPAMGGTLYTITGSNLGVYPGNNNVSVQFAGKPCPLNSNTWNRLVCVVPSFATTKDQKVPVTFSRGGEVPHIIGMYNYSIPHLHELMPIKSPTKGGVEVFVIGVNLNIGNINRTTLAVEFNTSRYPLTDVRLVSKFDCCIYNMQYHYDEDLTCFFSLTNRVVNATHISCETGDISNTILGSGSGTIIISIDGTDYSNDDVKLSYVMPIFRGLFDMIDTDQEEHLLQGLVQRYVFTILLCTDYYNFNFAI